MSYQWKHFLYENFKNNIFPLRNPYIFGGQSFVANIQAALFYPVDIFFYFINTLIAFKITFFLNYILSAIAMFFFLKELKLKKIACLFGAFMFIFSWFMVYYAPLKQVSNAIIWLPIINLFLLRLVKYNKNIDMVLLALSLGSQFLGGHIQFPYLTVLFIIPVFVFFVYDFNNKSPKLFLKFGVAIGFAILLSSVQLLPTYYYSKLCNRTGTSYYFATLNSLQPVKLLAMFSPDIFGNIIDGNTWGKYWRPLKLVHTHSEYITIPGIFLFILAALKIKTGRLKFFISLWIITVILSLGKYGYLYKVFSAAIPGFNYFRSPHRIMLFSTLLASIISAFGFNLLINKPGKINFLIKILKYFCIMIFILIIFSLVFKKPLFNKISQIAEQKYNSQTEHTNTWDYYVSSLNEMYVIYLSSIIRTFIISFLMFSICYVIKKYKHKFLILIFLLFILDIYTFNYKFVQYMNVKDMFRDLGNFTIPDYTYDRVYADVPLDHPLGKNGSIFLKLYSIRGYDPLVLNNFTKFISKVETRFNDVHPNTVLSLPKFDSPQLKLLNVKYIFRELDISKIKDCEGKSLLSYKNRTILLKNKSALPHFKFYSKIKKYSNKETMLNDITNGKIDLENELYIMNDAKLPTDKLNINIKDNHFKKIYYGINELNLNIESGGNSILFISENYSPDWQCYLNGKPTKIYNVDYLFCGVYVPKGKNSIKLNYTPGGFKQGILISIISLIFILIISAISFLHRKNNSL